MSLPKRLPPQYDEAGKQICGAKVQTEYGRCRRSPVRGKNRCKRHGGHTPSGPAHPAYKDGSRSIASPWAGALPERMRETFEAVKEDTRRSQGSLENHIAAIDTRLLELLKRVDAGITLDLWRQLRTAMQDFRVAQRATPTDVEGMDANLATMERLIQHGTNDAAAWEEVGKQVDRSVRVRDAETRRILLLERIVTMEQLDTMAKGIAQVLTEEIQDVKVLTRVAVRLQPVMALKDQVEAGGD